MATALSNCALVLTIVICVDKGVNRGRRWSMDLRQRSEREEKRRVGCDQMWWGFRTHTATFNRPLGNIMALRYSKPKRVTRCPTRL